MRDLTDMIARLSLVSPSPRFVARHMRLDNSPRALIQALQAISNFHLVFLYVT